MGGTIASLAAQGHDVLIVDLTDGEPTPHGNPETRARESAAAADILGVRRIQAGLKNREVVHDLASRHVVAGIIREHQSEILFAHIRSMHIPITWRRRESSRMRDSTPS